MSGEYRSTEAGIKRWLEFYGEVDRKNLCEFLGVTVDGWYSFTKKKLKANYYFNKILNIENIRYRLNKEVSNEKSSNI